MDWTGLDLNPVDWALYQPVWPGWSPLESTWIMWGRVKTSAFAIEEATSTRSPGTQDI